MRCVGGMRKLLFDRGYRRAPRRHRCSSFARYRAASSPARTRLATTKHCSRERRLRRWSVTPAQPWSVRRRSSPAHGPGPIAELQQLAAAEITIDTAGNEIDERWRCTPIGRMRHLDSGHLLEQFGGEMRRAAGAGRAHDELARRLGFYVGDELRHGLGRRGIRHEHEKRKLGDQRDRREIRDRIVVERTVQTWRSPQATRCRTTWYSRRDRHGRRFRFRCWCRRRSVIDDDLLTPDFRKLFGEDARVGVRWTPCGERHDHVDSPVGPSA